MEQGVLSAVLDDRATSADGLCIVSGLILLNVENVYWHSLALGLLHPVKLRGFTHQSILAVIASKCKNPTTRRQWDFLACVDLWEDEFALCQVSTCSSIWLDCNFIHNLQQVGQSCLLLSKAD